LVFRGLERIEADLSAYIAVSKFNESVVDSFCCIRRYMRDTNLVVDRSEAGRKGAKKRWAGKTIAQKKAETEKAREAAHNYWASMTPEQRSEMMKERAKKRKPRKKL
jgi:hypothetical protein